MKRIIYGTMGLGAGPGEEKLTSEALEKSEKVLDAVFDSGIDFIDTADIYQSGKSELAIGAYLKNRPKLRGEITIQSKLGIQKSGSTFGARYNFSYDYIMASAENILKRLGTDYLDILLLHRPDPLAERDDLYRAVDGLFSRGMIRGFGVSNMSADQMRWIEESTGRHICANQLELSLKKHEFVSSAVGFNNPGGAGIDFPIGTIEYCMRNDVCLQAWSPLARGLYTGRDLGGEIPAEVKTTRQVVARIGESLGISGEAVILAWLMRHPARIEPVIGTTDIGRIRNSVQALDIELTRDQWYELLVSARGEPMP